MSWQKIHITNDKVINQEATKLMDIFLPLFQTSSQPLDAALFSTYHTNSGTQTLYISPSATQILGDAFSKYLPESCDKPPREGLSLLIGDARAWQVFE